MLGEAKDPLQVEPDPITPHHVGSHSSDRFLWTVLGFVGLMLMGISAWAVLPSAPQTGFKYGSTVSADYAFALHPTISSNYRKVPRRSLPEGGAEWRGEVTAYEDRQMKRRYGQKLMSLGEGEALAQGSLDEKALGETRDSDVAVADLASIGGSSWSPVDISGLGPAQQTKQELWQTKAPWWQKDTFAEKSRKFRRTVFTHEDWVRHRSSDRFWRNLVTTLDSGIARNLRKEQGFLLGATVAVILANCITGQYQGLDGVMYDGPLKVIGDTIGPISLPNAAFSTGLPALSLLLVFRTNAGYSRWNEARTIWGGIINRCRNICSQVLTYFPKDERGLAVGKTMVSLISLYTKALRNLLRGSEDDTTFISELNEYQTRGLLTQEQVGAIMLANNRPMFVLDALRSNLEQVHLDPMERASIDQSITTLVGLTGSCERIFKSPVPLVYTRHTARFLAVFLALLPLGLWDATSQSWNHLSLLPIQAVLSFFLLGIEEIGLKIEEPFSILPLETFEKTSISATMYELSRAQDEGVWNIDLPGDSFAYGADYLPAGRR